MNANKYHLPVLKKIRIDNYDLYKCPFEIDLSRKLNVFYGTNGLGKTTLLNMIQYSIIGPYRGGVTTRTYKGQQKKKRPIFPDSYYRNRMKDQSKDSTVTSFFDIGFDSFEVKHSLNNNKLLAFSKNSIPYDGELAIYDKYEDIYFKTSEDMNSPKLNNLLVTKYQQKLVESSLFPDFSSLITMMSDGMFFTEDRIFTFWKYELSNLIISKYFMDQQSFKDYETLAQNIKYLDSQVRLKTYELSFIKRFLAGSEMTKNSLGYNDDEFSKIDELRLKAETIRDELLELDREIIDNRQEFEDNHNLIMNADNLWYREIFPAPYKDAYEKYEQSLRMDICPICGQKKIFHLSVDKCFVCGNHLEIQNSTDLKEIELEKKKLVDASRILAHKYQVLLKQSREKKELIREIERDTLDLAEKSKGFGKIKMTESSAEEQKIYEIELQRGSLIHQLENSKDEMKMIIKQTDEQIAVVFDNYKQIFRKYTNSFFGIENKSDISLVSSEGEKFFKFKLNGINREGSYDLSESQRIFLDLSYRFSILDFFHSPSYFICETPDSTLDMNSELNAVKTFQHYINAGNKLIISANARNSELVEALTMRFINDVEFIDLTEWSSLSKESSLQVRNVKLLEILKKRNINYD